MRGMKSTIAISPLFYLFGLAKLAGVIGVFAFVAHAIIISTILFALDAALLVVVVIASYRAMKASVLLPVERHPNADRNGYIAG
jgi:hypothetical protein